MNNDVIFAAAGSGKTYGICSKAIRLATQTKKTILLVTYTNEGVHSLETEYKKQNLGVIDSNVKITTWYSFVLSDFIKPYQCLLNLKYKYYKKEIPCDVPENYIKSISFYQNEDTPRYYNKGHIQYFINCAHDIQKNKVSELAYKCNADSSGKVIKRLEEIYSHIFFDELQDYAGWDLELLLLLFSSAIPTTCVGDYKQATFRTNNSLKNKQFRDDKIKGFFELQQSKGICSITYSKVTRRFNQDICDYVNTIHGDANNQVCQCCEMEFPNENTGVYIIDPKYLSDYCSFYSPTILRYDRDSTIPFSHNCQVLNYGNSKGLTLDRVIIIPVGTVLPFIKKGANITSPQTKSKFYVACTRAQYSVVFAIENFTETDHFKYSAVKIDGKELPALKYVK